MMVIIATVVFVAIVVFVLAVLAQRAPVLQTKDRGVLLQYSKWMKIVGVGLPLVALLALAALLTAFPLKRHDEALAVASIASFLALALVHAAIECCTVKIWVGAGGIRAVSGWRGYREYAWSEISRVTYSPLSGWIKVQALGKVPLRVHGWIAGFAQFQQAVTRNVAEDRWRQAFTRVSSETRKSVSDRDRAH